MASSSASSCVPRALRHDPDRAVGLVGHPAGHAEVHAAPQDEVAEPDTLDPAACGRLEADARRSGSRGPARSCGGGHAAAVIGGRHAASAARGPRPGERQVVEQEFGRHVPAIRTAPRPSRSRNASRSAGSRRAAAAAVSSIRPRSRTRPVEAAAAEREIARDIGPQADERLRCASPLGGRRAASPDRHRRGRPEVSSPVGAAVVDGRRFRRAGGGHGPSAARSATVVSAAARQRRRTDAGQSFGGPRVEQVEERPAELVAYAQGVRAGAPRRARCPGRPAAIRASLAASGASATPCAIEDGLHHRGCRRAPSAGGRSATGSWGAAAPPHPRTG